MMGISLLAIIIGSIIGFDAIWVSDLGLLGIIISIVLITKTYKKETSIIEGLF